jgi:hypothetical protein
MSEKKKYATKEKAVENGWKFMNSSVVAATTGQTVNKYVEGVNEAIQQLTDGINSYSGSDLGVGQLKGFVAEQYHAGTFNINAALNDSANRAFVDASNKHASVDISTNFGKDYSLKYYGDATGSAKNQAKNVIQAYHEYLSNSKSSNPLSFEDYLTKNGYNNESSELLKSVYYGQGRIIPTEQLDGAIKYLEREIAKESMKEGSNRAALLQNYKETLENLSDRLKDGKGIESNPLSKDEAESIAALCKDGKFKPEDFGLELSDLITSDYIIKQAAKAGMTAAALSVIIKTIPDICSIIDQLVKDGEVDPETLKKLGLDALSGGSEGFFKGALASSITLCCKAGKLGPFLQTADANVIAAITVLAFDTAKNGVLVLAGKMSKEEMAESFKEESFVTTNNIAFGTVGQMLIPIPGIGFIIGSVVGTVVGTTLYHNGDKWANTYYDNACYFMSYYAKLAEIDLERFIEDTARYKYISSRLESVASEDEMNRALKEAYEVLQIKLPWQGDFDEFMGNKDNHLVFE